MNNKFSYEDYEEEKIEDRKEIKEDEKQENKSFYNLNNHEENSTNNSKNMLKSIILIVVILGLVTTFAVVKFTGNKENNDDDSNTNQSSGTEIEEEEEDITIIDPNSKTRPYAVMINCHNGALPQAGLQDAYIVYEIMVEGGITRMMALFKDKDVSKIGSVRSARTQYLDYVYEHDAIYVHAGGAKDALNRISSEGISDVDVDGAYGFRDTSLNRSWEHTLFTSTKLLLNGVNAKGFNKTTDTPNLLTYTASLNLDAFNNTSNATNVSIKYSDYRTSNYTYDDSKKVYLRSMNSTKNIDLVTGEQYEVKNIIVYAVRYSSYTNGSSTQYQKIDNVGTGDGYYITEGKAIPITWEKTSHNSQTKYIVKETGKELVVNDGNTYIQIYPTSGSLTIN